MNKKKNCLPLFLAVLILFGTGLSPVSAGTLQTYEHENDGSIIRIIDSITDGQDVDSDRGIDGDRNAAGPGSGADTDAAGPDSDAGSDTDSPGSDADSDGSFGEDFGDGAKGDVELDSALSQNPVNQQDVDENGEGGETPIDLSQGDIIITEKDCEINGESIAGEGPYVIYQSDKVSQNTINIMSGRHRITFENLNIDVENESRKPAVLIAEVASATILLEGDNVLRSGSYCAGFQLETGDSAIASVTFDSDGDGTLTAYGGEKAAGIGGGIEASNGEVTIAGGAIFAYGGEGGAGIGGGSNSSSYKIFDCSGGIITMTGGSATAVGGNTGAGIGGGNHGDGGIITMTGGVVELAQGTGGGAGIGSGLGSSRSSDKGPGHYTGGTITLSGDCLIKKAWGGDNAAGIGGGMYGDSGDLLIEGCTVESARAGNGDTKSPHHGAAGIGGGYQGHCNVTIREAVIGEAIGSSSGAGIGTGGAPNKDTRPNDYVLEESRVLVRNSYVDLAQGGESGGAGIGGGVSTDRITVIVCNYRVIARGGGDGAGIGSGAYHEGYSYSSPTSLALYVNCGEIISESDGGGDPLGGGSGNEDKTVIIQDDEVNLDGVPSIVRPMSVGYMGYYDGNFYSIDVDFAGDELAFSENAEGPYEEELPHYVDVGEYVVYYRAVSSFMTYYGSDLVIIMDDKEENRGSSGGSGRSSGKASGSGTGDIAPGPDIPEGNTGVKPAPDDLSESSNVEEGDSEERLFPTEADEQQGRVRSGFWPRIGINPKTGDTAAAGLWILRLIAATGVFLVYLYYSRRKSGNERIDHSGRPL